MGGMGENRVGAMGSWGLMGTSCTDAAHRCAQGLRPWLGWTGLGARIGPVLLAAVWRRACERVAVGKDSGAGVTERIQLLAAGPPPQVL